MKMRKRKEEQCAVGRCFRGMKIVSSRILICIYNNLCENLSAAEPQGEETHSGEIVFILLFLLLFSQFKLSKSNAVSIIVVSCNDRNRWPRKDAEPLSDTVLLSVR